MKRNTSLLIIAFLLCSMLIIAAPQKTIAVEQKPLVVCTTTVLSSIVTDLAGDSVDVRYLVSPSMCPGHYDIKPGDVETIRSANLILAHGIEWLGWLRELINSANQTGDLHVPIYNVTGPWNTPSMLKMKYQAIASILNETLNIDVNAQLEKCLNSIDSVDSRIREIANENNFNGTSVACMLWQKSFVEYMGFNVIATYGPTEYLSQSDIEEIEANITEYNAKLIIDNLHSGVEIGKKIADDTNIVQVVLINFPDAVVGIHNVTEMMLYNVEQLSDGLKYFDYKVELNSYKETANLWQYISAGIGLFAVIEAIIIISFVKREKK